MRPDKTDFIDEPLIHRLLAETAATPRAEIERMIDKAAAAKGLDLREVAALIQLEDTTLSQKLFETALAIKQKIYGRRLVLFAPLYLSSYCINDCAYCGYHKGSDAVRKRLTMDEIRDEVKALEKLGHKRLMLDMGEDPVTTPIEYVLEAMKTIYETQDNNGEIRRVNVQIAATTVEDYRRLKEAGTGTYVLFQETFHRETYARMHRKGPKHNYDWHVTALDRAMQGGIDDVGTGVLYGLYDYRFEVVAQMMLVRHLEEKFGVGPHTISFPRLRAATSVDLTTFPHLVGDDQFKKIVAVLRLAVPYTGMIISTREDPEFRDEIIDLGISQMSAGSCVGVGGYKAKLDAFAEGRRPPEPDFDAAVPGARRPHAGRDPASHLRGGLHPELLHRLLSQRPHRRPLHGARQERADPEDLRAQRDPDVQGISDGLRLAGDARGRRKDHREASGRNPLGVDPQADDQGAEGHRGRQARHLLLGATHAVIASRRRSNPSS